MTNEVRKEQEKLAEKLSKLSADEKAKQAYGIMCWLQGHEAGYQAGVIASEGKNGEDANS